MELNELKETIERIGNNCDFKKLPKPMYHKIPEGINVKDYKIYATETPEYIEVYNKIFKNMARFTEEERQDTILDSFAYLYNSKTLNPKDDESIDDFYSRCIQEIPNVIVLWKEKSTENGISLEAYVNHLF